MKVYRLLAVALAAGVMFTGRPLAERVEQAPAAPAPASPFDSLHFRLDRTGDDVRPHRRPRRLRGQSRRSTTSGTAHGGVWKTTNNGATFEALFQDQGLISIGDVTISQTNPDLVWVGTGESNNRQSTSWGDGVYKSTDGGKTFKHMGLRDSQAHQPHRHRPEQQRHRVRRGDRRRCSGPGGDRGIYKTTDGGKTWKQVLKVDDDTGANDLVMRSDRSARSCSRRRISGGARSAA